MSWQQLKEILDAQRQNLTDEAERRPVACPNDGEPLQEAPGGRLHCKFDGWIWPDMAVPSLIGN